MNFYFANNIEYDEHTLCVSQLKICHAMWNDHDKFH